MLRTFNNPLSCPQVVYDQWGNPITAAPGETVEFEGDETFHDISELIFKTITVGQVTYTGYAKEGTAVTQAGWAIFRSRTVGGVLEKLWSGGKFQCRSIWNNYASLSYS